MTDALLCDLRAIGATHWHSTVAHEAADEIERLRADLMPDLSAVISWLENGCDPKEAVKELRLYQSRRSVIAIRAAQSQCTTPPPEPQASGPAP